ncbi:MAG: XRE family transcriptional regulator [Eubacterium sp.]|nr:XRE family transcriptional regulator [Eubacterium sp.]
MNKSTDNLLEELKAFADFGEFYNENKSEVAAVSLSDYLQELITKKRLNKADVVSQSEMSEVYVYQIISGIKTNPKREKLLCIAFGMKLSLTETQELLKKTGYAPLYAKRPFDAIIIYGLAKRLSVVEVNGLLFEYGQETLG